MLEVRDLVATYGPVTALDGVSLTVPAGQITAVLGANGAGKTTLLRTVSGLVRPKAGSVHLEGQDITRVPVEQMVRRGMAHVPEGRGVIAELTIEENLRLGALVVKGGDQEAEIGGSTRPSRRSTSAASAARTPCRAASGRCSSSAARCCRVPRSCCWTSPAWASRP